MNPDAPKPTTEQRARADATYRVDYLGRAPWSSSDAGYGIRDTSGALVEHHLPTAAAAELARLGHVDRHARLIAWDDAHREVRA